MKYMLMIYDKQELYDTATPEMIEEAMKGHAAFYQYMVDNYAGFVSERLNVPATATSLTTRPNGDWVMTDGPFPESKEAIGGYYIFDARDLDEAIDVAKHCPCWVGLELRPLIEYGG